MNFFRPALYLCLLSAHSFAQSPSLQINKTELPNTFKLEWDSVVGKSYFLQQSSNLAHWNYFPEVMAGIGSEDWIGVASTADKSFYRIIRSDIPTHDVLTADHDGDGIPSYAELTVTNTDPLKFSTAGNGISDRELFPNPSNGIYTDSANGIQYVIVPNSPGASGSPTIVATHYFEAPDYVIEYKRGSMSLEKKGYAPFVVDSTNESKRYLTLLQAAGAADLNSVRIPSDVWQVGWSSDINGWRVVFVTSDTKRLNTRDPFTGVETIGSGSFPVGYPTSPPWGWTQSTWRGRWYNSTTSWYYDIPPYSFWWDARCYPFYEETLQNENTIEMVGNTAKANPPAYPGTWTEGNPWANWDHWDNDLGISYSRTKFRIRNKNGITDGEPAQVFVYFDPEGGEREQIMHVQWDGQGTTSPEYTIDPALLRPNVEGTFHINAGSMFFELDLAQAEARKSGETLVIRTNPDTQGGNTLLRGPTTMSTTYGYLADVRFPGMNDSWYDGATITLSQSNGTGAAEFIAVDPNTGHEVSVPFDQNLAADFFHSRGYYSGYDWKIEGATPGHFTCTLTYTKGETSLVLTRTALIVGDAQLFSDLDNNGLIDEADKLLAISASSSGATSDQITSGTEYFFINDNVSNGSWDKEDSNPLKPPGTTTDDDAEPIAIAPGITEGLVWFNHPAISGLSFYLTQDCNLGDKINISSTSKFAVSSQNPLPQMLYVRADGQLTFPQDLQFDGNLTLNFQAKASDPSIELSALRLVLVKEFGAPNFFHAANDYILEQNTEVFVKDKGFPVNSSNPTAKLRVSALRATSTVMLPYEAYEPNYEHWIQSGSPGDGFETTNRIAVGLQEVMALDNNISLIINGNLCGFSNGMSAVEAAALSLIGMPKMTDKCHGNVKELNRSISSASSIHYDNTTNSPGTSMKGHRFAGPDPIPATSPPLPGGKHIAQYDDMKFRIGPGHAEPTVLADTIIGVAVNLTQFGGLATNYADPEKDSSANQMIGYFRAEEEEDHMIFTASDMFDPSGVTGYGTLIYNTAKSSGVSDLDGASHPTGTLKPIELLLLDGGTSTSLAYKNKSGNLMSAISQTKNGGFPYYINTFLRFSTDKPRP